MKNSSVNLRPVEKEDLDALFKWRNDETIFTQLGGGFFPVSKTEMSKWMDNFSKVDKTNIRFIIETEDRAVGFISLSNIDYKNKNGDLGLYIGEVEYHGKGIASKALSELEEFSKNHLGLKKIKLLMNNNNIAAARLYQNKGYEIIGVYKEERFIKGEWIDVNIMEKFL